MVSDVELCNRALIKVHGNLITSLTQDSEEATYCNALFNQIRDEVLRAHFWNFAIKQETLQRKTDTPKFDFLYKYGLPPDYIRIYRLDQSRARYKIKGNELHTDLAGLDIEYVSRVTDTTKFDAMFNTAFVLRMAAELAYPIAGSTERAQAILGEYGQFIKEAKRADGQEGTPDSLTADLFVDSRHEYSSGSTRDWAAY